MGGQEVTEGPKKPFSLTEQFAYSFLGAVLLYAISASYLGAKIDRAALGNFNFVKLFLRNPPSWDKHPGGFSTWKGRDLRQNTPPSRRSSLAI